MRGQRLMFVVLASALAGSLTFAQPGRGGSQWLTALADAQRTSWVRSRRQDLGGGIVEARDSSSSGRRSSTTSRAARTAWRRG